LIPTDAVATPINPAGLEPGHCVLAIPATWYRAFAVLSVEKSKFEGFRRALLSLPERGTKFTLSTHW
jgi:hypothetical protein